MDSGATLAPPRRRAIEAGDGLDLLATRAAGDRASDPLDGMATGRPPVEPARTSDKHSGEWIGGRYHVIGLLGRGGMGEVYRVYDTTAREERALKMLYESSLDSADMRERFRQEAAVSQKLRHSGIIDTYDIGESGARQFYTMSLATRGSLRTRLDRLHAASEPLPVPEALRCVGEILHALAYAHRQNVLHRDIKPENILIAEDGKLKIADFGLAKLVDPARSVWMSEASGTPYYMAPEQLMPGARVDARADLFAVGSVLYELLVGERPVGRFPLPSARRADAPVELDRVVERALASDPKARFPDAIAMASAIAEVGNQIAATAQGMKQEQHARADRIRELWDKARSERVAGRYDLAIAALYEASPFVEDRRALQAEIQSIREEKVAAVERAREAGGKAEAVRLPIAFAQPQAAAQPAAAPPPEPAPKSESVPDSTGPATVVPPSLPQASRPEPIAGKPRSKTRAALLLAIAASAFAVAGTLLWRAPRGAGSAEAAATPLTGTADPFGELRGQLRPYRREVIRFANVARASEAVLKDRMPDQFAHLAKTLGGEESTEFRAVMNRNSGRMVFGILGVSQRAFGLEPQVLNINNLSQQWLQQLNWDGGMRAVFGDRMILEMPSASILQHYANGDADVRRFFDTRPSIPITSQTVNAVFAGNEARLEKLSALPMEMPTLKPEIVRRVQGGLPWLLQEVPTTGAGERSGEFVTEMARVLGGGREDVGFLAMKIQAAGGETIMVDELIGCVADLVAREPRARIEDSVRDIVRKLSRTTDDGALREISEECRRSVAKQIRQSNDGHLDPRFAAVGDDTIVDKNTHLMWAIRDNGWSLDWPDAKRYVNEYRVGGHSDWRLPTTKELRELFQEASKRGDPKRNRCDANGYPVYDRSELTVFALPAGIRLSCVFLWSSETRGTEAATLSFSNGTDFWRKQDNHELIRVLPVRGET